MSRAVACRLRSWELRTARIFCLLTVYTVDSRCRRMFLRRRGPPFTVDPDLRDDYCHGPWNLPIGRPMDPGQASPHQRLSERSPTHGPFGTRTRTVRGSRIHYLYRGRTPYGTRVFSCLRHCLMHVSRFYLTAQTPTLRPENRTRKPRKTSDGAPPVNTSSRRWTLIPNA